MTNLQRITLTAFLAYFCTSGVLSTIGLVSGPMAAHFAVTVTDITRGFGWLTWGMLIGSALALIVVQKLPVAQIQLMMFAAVVGALGAMQLQISFALVKPLLGATGVALGIGLAAAALTITRAYAAERRASMLVITDACFSVSGTLCATLTGALLGYGLLWSRGYLLLVVLGLVLLGLVIASSFPTEHDASDTQPAVMESSGDKSAGLTLSIGFCLVALFLYTLGQWSMLWWLPQHLQTQLSVAPAESGLVVGRFWLGMLGAQLLVAWWVLRVGVVTLVLLSSVCAAALSIPLWWVQDAGLIPWLGLLWGFGNLAFLKIAISYATQLQNPPSPVLVSALLFGATTGTAVSPYITSAIVDGYGTLAVLQFSSLCYGLIFLLMLSVVLRASAR